MAKQQLTFDEALELGKELIQKDGDGNSWIRIDRLKKLIADQPDEQVAPVKTFEQAKMAAALDPELQAHFADRPPVLGNSPPAIEGDKS